MPLFLIPLLQYIFREVMVKFLVFASLFLVASIFMPLVWKYVGNMVNVDSWNGLLAQIKSVSGFFMDMFMVPFGIKAVSSAFLARFIIRRFPVVG